MGVTVLPDWGPELGKALGTLAQGIRHAIDPEREFKKKFSEAVTTNPDLAQHLTDYAHINGGLPPEITKYIPRVFLNSILFNDPSPDVIRTRLEIRPSRGLTPKKNL